jgi:hypothetical protein
MAKLTESYLKNMIKQVMNEMYGSHMDAAIVDLDSLMDGPEGMTIEEIADSLMVSEEDVIQAVQEKGGLAIKNGVVVAMRHVDPMDVAYKERPLGESRKRR